MISEERLAVLGFQVKNNGHTPETLVRMARAGTKGNENGPSIIVTSGELRELLSAYDHYLQFGAE
jgi:hypothetical protein